MMRVKEAVSVWGAEHNDIEKLFPGMEFLTSKSVIAKTKVFNLLHKVCLLRFSQDFPLSLRIWSDGSDTCWQMPKGALLHAHLDATVDVNFLLRRVLEQDLIYVRASAPLTTLSPTTNVLPEFSPFPKSEVKPSAVQNLTDPSYDGGCVPVKVARESFSLSSLDRKGSISGMWRRRLLTLPKRMGHIRPLPR